jgi:hypothetical protein
MISNLKNVVKYRKLTTSEVKTCAMKEGISKWKYIPCLHIGKLNIVKVSIPQEAICRFSAIPVK